MRNRDLECSELQHELSEAKKLFQRDKEALKKATKQHKDRAVQNGRTLETVGTQLEEAVSLQTAVEGDAALNIMLSLTEYRVC